MPVGIRTDNPQTIIIFDSEREWNLAKSGIFETDWPIVSNTESEDSLCVQGDNYYTKGEYKLALKCYNKGMKMFPLSIRILSNRSAVHMSMESWTLALQDVEMVLKIDPTHNKCSYRRASIYLHLQQPRKAKELLDTLVQGFIDDKRNDYTEDIIKSEVLLGDVNYYLMHCMSGVSCLRLSCYINALNCCVHYLSLLVGFTCFT
jgi:tetratricopeptide (TPR) repeat protein